MSNDILPNPIIPDFGSPLPKVEEPDQPITPNFDGPDCPAPPTPAASGVAGPSEEKHRKMVFVASNGNLDMAYPALIMANAALGEGVETHIFFTFWGFDLVTERTMDTLKFTMLGNTAMHLPMAKSMPLWAGMGALPGMTKAATVMMKKQLDDLEIPSVREMLDIIVASGGHLWGCKLSFDMNGLSEGDLYEGVEKVISATEFIEISEGAQIVFV